MSLPRILLFPFSINSPYFDGYSWAVELAHRMHATLKLFTTTSPAHSLASPPDSIYHSLLAAHGYYLEHYQHDQTKPYEVKYEPFISTGELKEELVFHLKNNPTDIVILDTCFSSSHSQDMKEIVRESGSAIILSTFRPVGTEASNQRPDDYFYDHLRQATLYKLPENFFFTLSNDHSVFNYLRKFVQKKSQPKRIQPC